MGWTNNLLAGLAADLDSAGIADWDPTGPYSPTAAAPVITLRSLPDRPDRAIALSVYTDIDTDDAGLGDVLVAVQARIRDRSASAVDDLADLIWDRWHGLAGLVVGSGETAVHTVLIRRRSSALLGVDGSRRWERADNYYIAATRPNTNRPD